MREREALERYLEQLEQSAEPDEVVIDPRAVASALEKLHRHSEPEVGFRRTTQGFMAAYNVPAAVDAEHAPKSGARPSCEDTMGVLLGRVH